MAYRASSSSKSSAGLVVKGVVTLLCTLAFVFGCGQSRADVPAGFQVPTTQVALGSETFTLHLIDFGNDYTPARKIVRSLTTMPRGQAWWMIQREVGYLTLDATGFAYDRDLLFVREDGTIDSSFTLPAGNATLVTSSSPIRHTIELAAGESKRLSLLPGASISLPDLTKAELIITPLPTIQLTLAGKPFTIEVADDQDEQRQGLMFRDRLAENAGMLFVFPESQPLGFWMRNTRIPLDIVYLDSAGKIISISQMEPFALRSYPAEAPGQYALELNLGTAERLGLKPGQPIDLSAVPKPK
jgi:uncharacterized protein